jgi:glutaryl-CoA dehydrogenase
MGAIGLAMKAIATLGSENQKERWLPSMARREKLGAFAPTEPDHGSPSVPRETSATRSTSPWGGLGRAVAAYPT